MPAKEIYEALELGYDVISVKQMIATCRSPLDDPEKSDLSSFLITLLRVSLNCQACATYLSRWRHTKPEWPDIVL
jgi:hypothetical protein